MGSPHRMQITIGTTQLLYRATKVPRFYLEYELWKHKQNKFLTGENEKLNHIERLKNALVGKPRKQLTVEVSPLKWVEEALLPLKRSGRGDTAPFAAKRVLRCIADFQNVNFQNVNF
jgi:hypothetical protein